ncbi:MurR/RpiR family transcriptional regulator (plasmid) [Brevundimonas staleyi]
MNHLDLESVLKSLRPTLGDGSGRVADFILSNPQDVVSMTLVELSEKTGVSDSLIIKLMKKIGIGGFQALKLAIAQSLGPKTSIIQEDLEEGDDLDAVIEKIFGANIQALVDTMAILKSKALGEAIDIIKNAERINIYGIGSAAPIAEDAGYRLLRIGFDVRVYTDSHLMAASASLATPTTAILTISHSGGTIETLGATKIAKEAGAKVVVITGYKRSHIQRHADVALLTLAKETKFRTEAMTSRIAQLSIVDALVAGLALTRHEVAVETLEKTFNALSLKRV